MFIKLSRRVRVHLTSEGKDALIAFGKLRQLPPEGQPFETSLFELMVIFRPAFRAKRMDRGGILTPVGKPLFIDEQVELVESVLDEPEAGPDDEMDEESIAGA